MLGQPFATGLNIPAPRGLYDSSSFSSQVQRRRDQRSGLCLSTISLWAEESEEEGVATERGLGGHKLLLGTMETLSSVLVTVDHGVASQLTGAL